MPKPKAAQMARREHFSEVRVLRLQVACVRGEDCDKIRRYIRRLRFACQKVSMALCFAQVQASTWDDVKGRISSGPTKELVTAVRSLSGMGNNLRDALKPMMRSLLPPSAHGGMVEELCGEVAKQFTTKDPEVSAQFRFLLQQGVRYPCRFLRMPLMVKAYDSEHRCIRIDGHSMYLRFDDDIGEMEFKFVGRRKQSGRGLDPYEWSVLRGLTSGAVVHAGFKLQLDDDGYLVAIIGYKKPRELADVDAMRCLEMAIEGDAWRLQLRSGHASILDEKRVELLPLAGWASAVDRIFAQTEKSKARLRSLGWHADALASERERRGRLTKARQHVGESWAHYWASRAVRHATMARCGSIKVFLPKAYLSGREFCFALLRHCVEYRCQSAGIVVSFESPEDSKAGCNGQAVDTALLAIGGD
jgi:hypothetical protein